MAQLAEQLGVGRATLYRWVGSRDVLLGEVVWSLLEPTIEDARTAARGVGVERVIDFTLSVNAAIAAFEPLAKWVSASPHHAMRVLASPSSPVQQRTADAWTEVLRRFAEEENLTYRIDIPTLAFVLVRVGQSFLWPEFLAGFTPDPVGAEDVYRALLS